MEKKITAVQQMINEFKYIKENKCKTAIEMLFFDGVIAIIVSHYLPMERQQIEEAFTASRLKEEYKPLISTGELKFETASDYFTQTYQK